MRVALELLRSPRIHNRSTLPYDFWAHHQDMYLVEHSMALPNGSLAWSPVGSRLHHAWSHSFHFSSHELPDILWRPAYLCKCQAPLDALQILSRHLVAHDMALLAVMQLLASTPLVDTHHGNTDRPSRLSNAQPQITVVGVHIPPFLGRLHDLHYRLEYTLVEVSLLELPEELRRFG